MQQHQEPSKGPRTIGRTVLFGAFVVVLLPLLTGCTDGGLLGEIPPPVDGQPDPEYSEIVTRGTNRLGDILTTTLNRLLLNPRTLGILLAVAGGFGLVKAKNKVPGIVALVLGIILLLGVA